jgi:hypothetical protein
LGSLAHGEFSPLVSDVDVGLIVRDPLRSGDAEAIPAVADAEKANGAEFCERLSAFWGTESTLSGEQLHYIDDHITRLDSVGAVELVRAFERWRDRLVRRSGNSEQRE